MILFDGIRLNNSTFRQGPNQYFFTIDSRTIESIEVTARRRLDALRLRRHRRRDRRAGHSQPQLDRRESRLRFEPGRDVRATPPPTASSAAGCSSTPSSTAGWPSSAASATAGSVGCGPADRSTSPATGEPPEVPRFDDDGVTQLGTGFKELAWDAQAWCSTWSARAA